jgi:hypothetical protein
MKEKSMSFGPVLRVVTVSAWATVVLCACQGDDNALPLPLVDAGSHSDATTVHDGGPEASNGGLSDARANPDANANGGEASADASGSDGSQIGQTTADGASPEPFSEDGPPDATAE